MKVREKPSPSGKSRQRPTCLCISAARRRKAQRPVRRRRFLPGQRHPESGPYSPGDRRKNPCTLNYGYNRRADIRNVVSTIKRKSPLSLSQMMKDVILMVETNAFNTDIGKRIRQLREGQGKTRERDLP